MVSPLPRNKRARNPRVGEGSQPPLSTNNHPAPTPASPGQKTGGFANDPFAKMEIN